MKIRKLQLLGVTGILILGSLFPCYAQKLPRVQNISVKAPIDIKIDGKTTEWNDQFQAHNLNNRIYYTIANDSDNLYLLVRASDDYANEKAIFGITFKIMLSSEKGGKEKESVVIRFPIETTAKQLDPIRMPIDRLGEFKKDVGTPVKRIDSLRSIVNKRLNETFKEIGVTGISAISEKSISIYNTENIKASAQLNDRSLYVYELAIPLKFLRGYINNVEKFRYRVIMNGLPGSGPNAPPTIMGNNGLQDLGSPDIAYVTYETYFSGEYSLAGK